jgi:aspartyl-tRNA(Asn)/glutamyl-tRNA(Gln) amidotransferase subunit A
MGYQLSMADDLSFATVAELGRMLRTGATSPVELTEHFLDRLDRVARPLNAVVTITADLALAQARQAEDELAAGIDRGPLHGIPYGAKDLLTTAGIPTTWGAEPFRNRVFDFDATVVRRLREAGAVLVAKLAMIELAGGFGYDQPNASLTGPEKNAWDAGSWAGGSSSGSGAAVGAGAVPFAIGTETWGSITVPAAYNGITGYRPTYGRVSRHGAMALCWTLDKIGPMAHTAEDCATILAAISGADPADRTTIAGGRFPLDMAPSRPSEPHPRQTESPPRHSELVEESRPARWRIGVLKDSTRDPIQPAVRANFDASLAVLAEFADLEDVEIPPLPYAAAASIIVNVEGAAAFEEFIDDGRSLQLTAPEDRFGGVASLTIPATDYLRALRLRRQAGREVDAVLAKFDAIVAPTLPNVANPINQPFDEYFHRGESGAQRQDRVTSLGAVGNLCGLPAISVPNGFGERGLPTGLEIMGRAFEDARVTAVATAYQERSDWHLRRPSATTPSF